MNLTEKQEAILLKAINLAELTMLISSNKAMNSLAKEILTLKEDLEKENSDFMDNLYKQLDKLGQ
jgi:hypothetical protein